MTTRMISYKAVMTSALDERCLDTQDVESLLGMRPGDAILCTCGILWVTQAGDPDDYMLRRGDVFVASRQGVVLVQALAKATYRLASHTRLFDWRKTWPISFPG